MSIAPLTLPRLDGELEVGGQDLVRERLHDARGVVPEQCRDVDDRTCHAAKQNSTAVDPCNHTTRVHCMGWFRGYWTGSTFGAQAKPAWDGEDHAHQLGKQRLPAPKASSLSGERGLATKRNDAVEVRDERWDAGGGGGGLPQHHEAGDQAEREAGAGPHEECAQRIVLGQQLGRGLHPLLQDPVACVKGVEDENGDGDTQPQVEHPDEQPAAVPHRGGESALVGLLRRRVRDQVVGRLDLAVHHLVAWLMPAHGAAPELFRLGELDFLFELVRLRQLLAHFVLQMLLPNHSGQRELWLGLAAAGALGRRRGTHGGVRVRLLVHGL